MIRKAIIIAALLATVAAWADMEWQTAIGQKDQVTSGLVAYWAMRNSGTTVYDEWAGGYNGTASNGVTFGETYAAVGQGASFDGTNDFLALPLAAAGSAAGSVSAWIKSSKSGTLQSIVSSADTAYIEKFVRIDIDTGNRLTCLSRIDIAVAHYVQGDTVMATGQWHHVVATADGSDYALYVNGAVQSLTTVTGDNSGRWFANVPDRDNLQIGLLTRSSSIIPFAGQIDEVRIYNRALTADEIKQLYRMGAIPKGIK
jgi:hypothetical protein